MQFYIGITDYNWYEYLKAKQANEVNFWKPSTQNFKVLQANDLFLFKLHHPRNFIVGGGYFVKYSLLPTSLAWSAFGDNNGTNSLAELNDVISKYRIRNKMPISNPQIGCIILTDVFYFDEKDWIPAPESFGKNIVQGKRYCTEDEEVRLLFHKYKTVCKINHFSQLDWNKGHFDMQNT